MADNHHLLQVWLNLQCKMLAGAMRAVVLQQDQSGGHYHPVAHWPDESAVTPALSNTAAVALRKRVCIVDPFSGNEATGQREGDIVAFPFSDDGVIAYVIAAEVAAGGGSQRSAVARALQWGCAWLRLLLSQQAPVSENRLRTVIDMVATTLEHPLFQDSASAVVTELSLRLGCERVSLGFLRGSSVHIHALSRTASTDTRMRLLRVIAGAMDEALDQDMTIAFPVSTSDQAFVTQGHAELSREFGSGSICTVPISYEARLLGAITFEHRDKARFDPETIAFCEAVVALAGPILAGKLREERWFAPKIWDRVRVQAAKLAGPRHVPFKLGTASAVALAMLLSFATGAYRVSADAALEGMIQRAVTAPFDGYVAESDVRPGDLVTAGQLLCSLDDQDLSLEQLKWSSEAGKLRKEYREAMAAHESARVRILQAQLEQAAAQLALVDEQLARTRVSAPVDGMIVAGDLSQSLGAPVGRGDVLFEVAPLDDYRVMLAVDEREIGQLRSGQAGYLALAGLPNQSFPIIVERITPISTAADGQNFFTVQAKLLTETTYLLRPGMQGVGKIYIGRRKLIWIWTHDLVDWLRLRAWAWA